MEKRDQRINLRVTPTEKAAWEAAANGSVSEWLRGLANDATSTWPKTGPLAELGEEEFMPRLTAAMKAKRVEKCPRWMHHRPGVYCGSC